MVRVVWPFQPPKTHCTAPPSPCHWLRWQRRHDHVSWAAPGSNGFFCFGQNFCGKKTPCFWYCRVGVTRIWYSLNNQWFWTKNSQIISLNFEVLRFFRCNLLRKIKVVNPRNHQQSQVAQPVTTSVSWPSVLPQFGQNSFCSQVFSIYAVASQPTPQPTPTN